MLSALHNALDFPLRQFFRWRRRGLQIRNEPKTRLFADLPDEARPLAQATADRLLNDYRLRTFFYHSRADNYCENLYYLEMLEAALQRSQTVLPDVVPAADIGPSQWFYVQALYALLKWYRPVAGGAFPVAGRVVTLAGWEADAYRVYLDFYSRYDYAQAHIRDLADVDFVPLSFERQPQALQLVTMLFPFVFLKDHLQWGLPRQLFAPDQLLADAWASLAPAGALIIVNQGEAEHDAQRELLQKAGIAPAAAFRHESLLYRYELPRYVLVVRR
jgi:hypothetical protein